jgi:F-type H+-transporting ATPase subunit alpha
VGGEAQWAAYRAVAGDLKLAYAQFEELETFARFGARLDDDTRKIIEHGRRIRACLKQPEFAPLAVPAQITVLLALTANLFDPVPLEQMAEAGHAVREAAANIPAEVSARFETAAKLNDEDKKAIIEIARQSLAPFQPKPDPKPEVKPETKADVKVEPKAETKGDIKDKADAKPKEEVKPKPGPEVKAETKPGIESKPEPPAEVEPAETGPKEKP